MKTILFVLFVIFMTAVVQPGVNVSFAQNNCTCAECGYPCKTPMVHDSKCKYNNNKRTSEEKSEEVTSNKSVIVGDDTYDVEYEMLQLRFKMKMVADDATTDAKFKEKQLLELKYRFVRLNLFTEEQKLMFNDTNLELQNLLNGLK